ncbi:hypothetical protein [Moorena sp. SIO4G3]|uniref:hypothetical protein n=1 Tax=Moorena sp. SIO4G3 TaxID=2607821 RepID=UPI00142CE84D|nr:hypothetical protein [Moorena sp. SIO4G3]NEO75517.1 hypothetical protein [Moorena sp. SIO4G3]
MSKNRLLIVFGGTDEHEYQTIFPSDQVSEVDILQFNFVNWYPNIWCNQNRYLWREHVYTNWEYGSSIKAKAILDSLKWAANKLWDDFTWFNVNPAGLSAKDVRGLTDISQTIIEACIKNWDNPSFDQYEDIFVVAHSRGCLLGISNLPGLHQKFGNKLKRVVLLDPVCMRVGGDNPLSENVKTFHQMVNSVDTMEYHIVIRTKKDYPFASYAGELVGINSTDPLLGLEYHRKFSDTENIRMKNVYIQVADMGHSGMLTDKFQAGFPHYMNIISQAAWNTVCVGNDEMPVTKATDQSLQVKNYCDGKIYADGWDGNDWDKEIRDEIIDSSQEYQMGRYVAWLQCYTRRLEQNA